MLGAPPAKLGLTGVGLIGLPCWLVKLILSNFTRSGNYDLRSIDSDDKPVPHHKGMLLIKQGTIFASDSHRRVWRIWWHNSFKNEGLTGAISVFKLEAQ